ncbi:hypothetical protein D4764_06G0014150 [Takifugu flavidus]|uniref:Reverse transcriptase domain-containing protein n=1 Tax=Takifugu flavidus TaxID=433684 RepID=A0A5C6MYE4_9TELE|nr:hypothetical protein D4764_06G0014150 [Takifugu flavidus]
MCFVDLEKAYDRVPRSILWGVLREYGVDGPLIRAVQSLYRRSRSLVPIAGCKSDSFPVRVGQGCPLPPVLFITFIDRISRCSRGVEGVEFGRWKISSLLFADDVVLLAPSSKDLQHMLGRFTTECEAAWMRISTSKSESMVLARKKVECLLRVGEEVLPQVEEFKYLGILFARDEGGLSRKAKLTIYRSIYVPILTYGHQRWVMTKRMRLRIQAAEMSFLHRVAGLNLRDRVRSPDIWEELGVEPLLLHIKRSHLGWLGHLARMPFRGVPDMSHREEASWPAQD